MPGEFDRTPSKGRVSRPFREGVLSKMTMEYFVAVLRVFMKYSGQGILAQLVRAPR